MKVAQSCLTLCNPWIIQAMDFSRPECWAEQPFPSPGDLPNPGIEPTSPAWQADSSPAEPPGKPPEVGEFPVNMNNQHVPSCCSDSGFSGTTGGLSVALGAWAGCGFARNTHTQDSTQTAVSPTPLNPGRCVRLCAFCRASGCP